tara:strand:- start:908 stop:1036 length:129 start_codon:yes stop_codon:yes gene_type:complete
MLSIPIYLNFIHANDESQIEREREGEREREREREREVYIDVG